MGLRIDEETETGGLDLHEHGTVAYPEFLMMAPIDEQAGPGGDTDMDHRLDAIQIEAVEALRRPFSTPAPSA